MSQSGSGSDGPNTDKGSGGALATAGDSAEASKKTGGRRVSERSVSEASPASRPRSESRFFEIYKPGQGYYTRICTAIGAGILILGAGNFIFNEMAIYQTDAQWTLWLRVGVPTVVVVGLGLLLYWLVGVKRGACDFLIATEGEMKKVSWSSRNELIGSTKVVIATTLFLAILLFVVDSLFKMFFMFIGVLETGT